MNADIWEPQPSLAWAACHEVVDGRFCYAPAAGWARRPYTGSMSAKFAMCEKHGNPSRAVPSPSGKGARRMSARRLQFNPEPIRVVKHRLGEGPQEHRCDFHDGRGRCTSYETTLTKPLYLWLVEKAKP